MVDQVDNLDDPGTVIGIENVSMVGPVVSSLSLELDSLQETLHGLCCY